MSLLTNDFEMDALETIEFYRKRWAVELLFKQLKQNFPLCYFYGESKNAIMIQSKRLRDGLFHLKKNSSTFVLKKNESIRKI